MAVPSDDELLEKARRFDLSALAAIYDRYNDGVYYYALRLLGEESIAEDCAADVFSRLLQALKNGGGPRDNLKGYLYRSAHNWITDHYRRQPAAPLALSDETPSLEDNPSREAERNLEFQRARAALFKLTPEQRQVVTLRFLEGWEIGEVAQCLNKPAGAVKSLQHRALTALKEWLLPEEERA